MGSRLRKQDAVWVLSQKNVWQDDEVENELA